MKAAKNNVVRFFIADFEAYSELLLPRVKSATMLSWCNAVCESYPEARELCDFTISRATHCDTFGACLLPLTHSTPVSIFEHP